MITADNTPSNALATDEDFTVEYYRGLLRLAKAQYRIADYRNIPFGERFVLWRHDCDYSLNRALALAKIEQEEGIRATYFLNPHCSFYNLLEAGQARLVREILQLGHDIGVHFDAAFHGTTSEAQLEVQVRWETRLLAETFGLVPAAFSFHNPSLFHLGCESESYGGLVNCYSRRFKAQVPYCSDSNGYWRFRRLYDVLQAGADPCLQVLTHPGWWQSVPLPPRRRIFRAVYGRAADVMRAYDGELARGGRANHAGPAEALRFLQATDGDLFALMDYLWNQQQLPSLFLELSRLYQQQGLRLCRAIFVSQWGVPADEVDAVISGRQQEIVGTRLLREVLGPSWRGVTGVDDETEQQWALLRDQLIRGGHPSPGLDLDRCCVDLCRAIESVAAWGRAQPFRASGLSATERTVLQDTVARQRYQGEWADLVGRLTVADSTGAAL